MFPIQLKPIFDLILYVQAQVKTRANFGLQISSGASKTGIFARRVRVDQALDLCYRKN